MTEEQKTGVQNLLSGTDVVAAMPTGSGKSLIFQSVTYSAVKRGHNCVTLIVTPLKAISYTHVTTFREKVCYVPLLEVFVFLSVLIFKAISHVMVRQFSLLNLKAIVLSSKSNCTKDTQD